MARRALFGVIIAAILIGIAAWFLTRDRAGHVVVSTPRPKMDDRAAVEVKESPNIPAIVVGSTAGGDAPSHLADALNLADGNIRRDLEIVSELFVAWQTNFPHQGNPVGENSEITAALTGSNALDFAFVARDHRAINSHGELCDRWGTPFRLHQSSGTMMEIRSAGPDRKFATADDAFWPAEPAR